MVSVHALQHGAYAKTHKPCRRECIGLTRKVFDRVMGKGKEAESWGWPGVKIRGSKEHRVGGSWVGRKNLGDNVIPTSEFFLDGVDL